MNNVGEGGEIIPHGIMHLTRGVVNPGFRTDNRCLCAMQSYLVVIVWVNLIRHIMIGRLAYHDCTAIKQTNKDIAKAAALERYGSKNTMGTVVRTLLRMIIFRFENC